MIPIKQGNVITAILAFAVQASFAANLYVSKPDGGGAYNTIMAAIRDAKAGDSVIILDNEIYLEQVTIDSTKGGLVLASASPTSRLKPTIKWQDKLNIGPKSCPEAKIESNITFDQNGALQIKRVRGVIIDGIAVDGGGPWAFGYNSVWGNETCNGQLFPLQHGNAAIAVWVAGDAIIRNCDISNSYFGISVKDRNEGGINANPNPADIEKKRIVPLSGFGKTGNHLFEHNRIHNNSFGMFFESTWDLASVIRYNLFYENHHQTVDFLNDVYKLTSDGTNQPGGAIMFKDHLFSPIAIYNNTFWHNYLIFIGAWRPGAAYLIFNNIYAEPYMYWGLVPKYQNSFLALDASFVNRTHHSVYACQTEAPKEQIMTIQEYDQTIGKSVIDTFIAYQPRIMNGMGNVESINLRVPLQLSDTIIMKTVNSAMVQGNRIIGATGTNPTAFPASANIRWLETKFKSKDPTSADFLVPDWDDSLVNQFILDQGWPDAGILDADGSIADLGAIPFGGKPTTEVSVRATSPVIISPNQPTVANVSFEIKVINGSFNNPKIKYIKWITPVPYDTNAFGGNLSRKVTSNIIYNVPIPSKSLAVGANDLSFTIPAHDLSKIYGFFELIVEGTDNSGNKVTSSVGFLSYRRLDYIFDIQVLSPDLKDTMDEVTVGQPYVLRIRPLRIGQKNQAFTSKIDTVDVRLQSPYTLWTPDADTLKIIGGIPEGAGKIDSRIMFTKVPESGKDAVIASGIFSNPLQGNVLAIWGISHEIKINPGPPEKILFTSPPSKGLDIVYPGVPYDVRIQIYDKYDNKVKQVTAVKLESSKQDIGNVDGASQVDSDTSGLASLKIKVTNGDMNDTFPIVGTLVMNGNTDNARLIVGRARNRYFIFYGDTLSYDPSVEIPLTTCTGVRVPVQIRASTNGFDTATTINNQFSLEFNNDALVAYKSDAETDTVPITSSSLVNGIATIWIQATRNQMRGATITIVNLTLENRIHTGTRAGINFQACQVTINRGEYYAGNGFGRVDSLILYYLKAIKTTDIPDSLQIFWPTTGQTNRKIALRSAMTIDPVDSTRVYVKLPEPFPEGITYGQDQTGTSYLKNPLFTDMQISTFPVKEKVGPLIESAVLIERLDTDAPDTLIVTFTEFVQGSLAKGESLLLTRDGGIALKAESVQQTSSNVLKVIVANQGVAQSPKAGDLLKIRTFDDGKSLIIDGNGNTAHPDNRPVVITLQEIAPQITDAFYQDRNADGLVDRVTITFNKKVRISKQTYKINFRSNIVSDVLSYNRASYVSPESTSIVIDLSSGGLPLAAQGFTDGAMTVFVNDSMFTGSSISHAAMDKAAPVIDSAAYIQGMVRDDGTPAADTLVVFFSEVLKDGPFISGKPFEFLRIPDTSYTLSLNGFNSTNRRLAFIVNPHSANMVSENVAFTRTGDSVRIFVESEMSMITDVAGNIQVLKENRWEKLVVIEQPLRLDVKMGPNPFVPEPGKFVKIEIGPSVKNRDQPELTFSAIVTILDNMGNLLYTQEETKVFSDKNKTIQIRWDGTNARGRIVGTGTYVVYVKTIDLRKGTTEGQLIRKLAVKREK